MDSRFFIRVASGVAAAALIVAAGSSVVAESPLAIETARITIAGTSNVHDYTATTTDARVTQVRFGSAVPGAAFWDELQRPGGLQAFDVTIAAGSLKSTKDGLDKNMYKALKVKDHPEITFHLAQMESTPAGLKATGTLTVAGVEREVALALKTVRKGATLQVTGETDVLMTDFGIAPPKAMLGMVKADPKIKVTFEVVLAIAAT